MKIAATSTAPKGLCLIAVWLLTGCQHLPGGPQPARLVSPEQSVQQALQERVSSALGTPVVLSPRALTETSRLIVEAPPSPRTSEQNKAFKLGRPDHFTLWKKKQQCWLRHEKSGREWVLANARCAPK
ncbi:hypothetical protein KO507_07425 [Gilvimarinus agarilyticus]|uniref:hypothetical protein n=1 Tax=Gilvimarinus sp. 2_MG-2023 TaxID=3062666 RepID=UPI001C08B5F1|nr:hypothetical protein [Gilvimarinus sp. 2_MG-2023]MBU2885589.1 hypothetical protein [Gilvimarinus agarilyticus]MDO6570456.1 hypothetical protein [Gilvimarinus sp. 2_MG-2023]